MAVLTLAGMLVAFALSKAKVKSYWPYIIIGGALSWVGLFLTGVHSSLALVFIVPFLLILERNNYICLRTIPAIIPL